MYAFGITRNYAKSEAQVQAEARSFLLYRPPGGTGAFSGTMLQYAAPENQSVERLTTYSVEAWVKIPASQTGNVVLAGRGQSGTDWTTKNAPWNYVLGIDGSGRIVGGHTGYTRVWDAKLKKYVSVWGADVAVGLSDIRDNQWHHVYVTTDGKVIAVYVDGVREGTREYVGSATKTVQPTVVGQGLAGYVDEVRIWNRMLTSAEVESRKGKSLQGNEGGLIDYFPFDFNRSANAALVRNFAAVRGGADSGIITAGGIDLTVNAPVIINAMLGLKGILVAYFPMDDQGVAAEDFMHRNNPSFAGRLDAGVHFRWALDRETFAWNSPLSPDSDGDGMPDWWETQYGLLATQSSGLYGATGDPDQDGLSNLSEYMIDKYAHIFGHTVPGDDLRSRPNQYDTDGDGIPDGDEDGDGDGDDDGLTDSQELAQGTLPSNSLDPRQWRVLEFDGDPNTYGVVRLDRDNHDFELTSAFTLECWVYREDESANVLIQKVRQADGLVNYEMGFEENGHPYLACPDAAVGPYCGGSCGRIYHGYR